MEFFEVVKKRRAVRAYKSYLVTADFWPIGEPPAD